MSRSRYKKNDIIAKSTEVDCTIDDRTTKEKECRKDERKKLRDASLSTVTTARGGHNCHAQNGHSPLAAWHRGLETARAFAPLSPMLTARTRHRRAMRSAAYFRRVRSFRVTPGITIFVDRLFYSELLFKIARMLIGAYR